jgi:hypothetical protein
MANRTRRVAVVCLVTLLGFASCGDDDDTGAPGTTANAGVQATGSSGATGGPSSTDAGGSRDTTTGGAPTSRVTATTTATTAEEIRSPADLEPLLITNVPAGYERQADDVGDTGPSDLDKAVSDDGEDDAQEFYASHGFIAGYQRLWAANVDAQETGAARIQNADLIVVFLYAFKDASGAQATMDRITATVDESAAEGVTEFQPEGVPGARGFAGGNAEDGYGAILVFTKGGFLVQMVAGTRAESDNRAVATQLARDQYARL